MQRAPRRDIVDREVVRVITPGTVIEPGMLAATQNNYLAALIAERETGPARQVTYGQLNDLEIYSPHQEISEPSHIDALIAVVRCSALGISLTVLPRPMAWAWGVDALLAPIGSALRTIRVVTGITRVAYEIVEGP